MFSLPKVYPITDVRLSGLSHREQTEKLISAGAKFIQIREKQGFPKDFYESAKAAIEIARKKGAKIIINDRADIALALNADGVHLGQDDLPPEKAREILGTKSIIGFSTHSLEQAIEAVKLPIDYIAIGPVFETFTKENPDETVGLEGIRKVRNAIGDFPLAAIGGITLSNFAEVFSAGADSIAVISEVVGFPKEIKKRFNKFMQI